MAENLDLSISGIKLCTGHYGTHVLITVLALFDGYVFGKPEDLAKTDVLLAKFSKKWQKLSPEEIQQMQDNIQWIKGHKKIN
jgi:hypothetical protein